MPACVTPSRTLRIFAALALVFATANCTSLLGDFSSSEGTPDAASNDATTLPDGPSGGEGGNSGVLGKTCSSTADCAGGPCVDGVCCSTACDGVCMRCDLPNSKGTCSPVPAHQDPDKECVSLPLPEAGPVVDAGAPSDAGDAALDGALADADITDADVSDAPSDAMVIVLEAGPTINYPDSGLQVFDAGSCTGSCNGAGACAYPAAETTCGTQFCNTGIELGRLTCDGTGRCTNIDVSNCKDYACENGACATGCSATTDCQPTDRCTSGTCTPKLGNGLQCNVPTDCESGYCVSVPGGSTSVCCTSACTITGGNCAASAQTTGQCTCPACADGGTCAVFYPDNDNDGHGDENATVASGTPTLKNAIVACAGTPPLHSAQYPAAYYVTNNDDCNDQDNRAYPGATYETSAEIGVGGYDFDCDGKIEMQYPQYPGQSCHVCGAEPGCGTSSCGTSGANGYGSLSCALEYGNCCSCLIFEPLETTQSLIKQNFSENTDLIIRPLCCACSTQSCGPNDRSGFIDSTTIQCGQEGTYATCGSCSSTTLGATSYSYPLQGCK
jgi:hypothetical protein